MKHLILRAGRAFRHESLRLISVGCIFLFAVLPLFTLAFQISGKDWAFIARDRNFRQAVVNSLLYASAAAAITTLLALAAAYLLESSSLRGRQVLVVLLTLGMLVPTVSVGLGLRILFGTNGFLDLLFGLEIEVRGMPGLIMGSVMTSFPATFLILYDALHYEDKGPHDAAAVLGIGRVSTFFRLTLPYLRIALISAFFACFTLDHLAQIFSNTYGVGLAAYIRNSLLLALLTASAGTCFAYLLGYLSVRMPGRAAKAVDLLALSTIAVPGLVLGIGYIFLFRETGGFFYGTVLILAVANIFHFLGSPYLLAKNCLGKINSDYEIIGETLGIRRGKIIARVLLPHSLSTLTEMFSYFFLNSMITISAVAFLCTYDNQPLSILITTYEKNSNYEMQSVISLIILVLNLGARGLFALISAALRRAEHLEREESAVLTRLEFDCLTWLEKNGRGLYSQRKLADDLTITLSSAARLVRELADRDWINLLADGGMEISAKGLKMLEPYRVRRAVILAAGFGQRLAPVTLDTPKPLVKVNGVRILDTLLDALVAKGITNITVVRGYKKEQFDQLLEKYPTLRFIDNPEFNLSNNISSILQAADRLDRCYVCEADLYISNPEVINKYEYRTNYLGARVTETDDWCFQKKNGYAANYRLGGTDCYQAFGISYWDSADSERLKADLEKVYHSRGGRENLWEQVPLKLMARNYRIEIRKCHKSDILEIDNFVELIAADPSYARYPGYEEYRGR